MVNELENRFELVRVITHNEDKDMDSVCGIYEFKFDNRTHVFIRHDDEICVVSFFLNESIKDGIETVTDKVKEVLLYKVEEYLKENSK